MSMYCRREDEGVMFFLDPTTSVQSTTGIFRKFYCCGCMYTRAHL